VIRNRPGLAISLIALSVFTAGCVVLPEPIESQRHVERSKHDLSSLRATEFVPTTPIKLHEAMARAVAFNLRHRVAEIEREIANAELDKNNFDMLPALDLSAAHDSNNVQISNSDDRTTNTASATFAWNILDLGVSYARANQQADEVLIKQEQERKALQDIIRQVNTAFWRAAAGQRLMDKVHSIARDLEVAMHASREMERTKATDVISAVAFRRDIVESVKQALSIRRELQEAKAQLAELLNIRPGTDFELALPATNTGLPRLPMSVEHLEIFALENRPELRVEEYNERISDWQAREALYNMLPGLKVSAGQNYSSDSTNLTTNWISTGVNMGMNLFQLFSGSSEIEVAEGKAELARRQRLALSLAVLTQVHMSRIKFNSATQQMRLAHEIAQSDRKLTRLVRTDGQFLNNDYFEAVSLATQQLRSEMDEQRAYVNLISAHTDLMHAVGLDVFPDNVPFNDVNALGDGIRAMMMQWNVSDETAKIQTDSLPLDQLVSNIVSSDQWPEYSVAEAAPNKPAIKLAPTMAEVLSETIFTAEMLEEAEITVPPEDEPEQIFQANLNEELPDELDENPSTSQTIAALAPNAAEQRNDTQPEEDITPETVELLNRVAPSSRGDPTIEYSPAAGGNIPVEADKSESPPTTHNRDEVPAARQSSLGRIAADDQMPIGAHPESAETQAIIEPQQNIAALSEEDPSPVTLRSIDWEFSLTGNQEDAPANRTTTDGAIVSGVKANRATHTENEPNRATPEPQTQTAPASQVDTSPATLRAMDWEFSVTHSEKDTPAISPTDAGTTRAEEHSHNGAGNEADIPARTVERLNRIAPSSQGKPSATPPQPFGWEFSIPTSN
jgi:outer membrane protein TolC